MIWLSNTKRTINKRNSGSQILWYRKLCYIHGYTSVVCDWCIRGMFNKKKKNNCEKISRSVKCTTVVLFTSLVVWLVYLKAVHQLVCSVWQVELYERLHAEVAASLVLRLAVAYPPAESKQQILYHVMLPLEIFKHRLSGDLNTRLVWYSNKLNSGLVWYSNGRFVWLSNGPVFKWWSDNRTEKACLWSKIIMIRYKCM